MNHMAGWRDLMVLVNWDFSLRMCSVSCCLFKKKKNMIFKKKSIFLVLLYERDRLEILKEGKKGTFLLLV